MNPTYPMGQVPETKVHALHASVVIDPEKLRLGLGLVDNKNTQRT